MVNCSWALVQWHWKLYHQRQKVMFLELSGCFQRQIVEIVLVFPCKEDPLCNLSCNPSCSNNIKNPYHESENVIKDTLAKVTAIAPSLLGSYWTLLTGWHYLSYLPTPSSFIMPEPEVKKVNTSPIIGDDLCLRFLDFFYGEKTVIVLMLPLPILSLQKTTDIKQ